MPGLQYLHVLCVTGSRPVSYNLCWGLESARAYVLQNMTVLASPHWAWHNLQNGLAVGEAAKLEAGFFQGSAPIELYRDVFYCTAGIYKSPQQWKPQTVTCGTVIHLATRADLAVLSSPWPTNSLRRTSSDNFSCLNRLECTHVTRVYPAGIILLFGLLAVVFRKVDVGSYRTLPDAAGLIFVSHNAFFLVFLLTAIPYSFAMVSVLFAPSSPSNLLEKPVYRCISFSLAFQVVMYALEVRKAVQADRCKWWLICINI